MQSSGKKLHDPCMKILSSSWGGNILQRILLLCVWDHPQLTEDVRNPMDEFNTLTVETFRLFGPVV